MIFGRVTAFEDRKSYRGLIFKFSNLQVFCQFQARKMAKFSKLNKTKYTMDPGIYYLLEADEDNTNRY